MSNSLRDRSRKSLGRWAGVAAVILVLAAVVPAAQAQPQPVATVYLAPFTCGYETGNVPFLNNPNPPLGVNTYEDVKPGNYATTVSITDLTLSGQTVVVFGQITTSLFSPTPTAIQFPVVSPGQALLGITHATFASFEVDCLDIALAAGGAIPTPGATIKGKLLIASLTNQPLDVVVTQTYESQNGFQNLWAFGIGPFGVLTAIPFLNGTTLPGVTSSPKGPVSVGEGFFDIGGAGAGGLGLGASIDVERCPPLQVVTGSDGTDGVNALVEALELSS